MRRSILLLWLTCSLAVSHAQTGGQVCVRAYEDRNNNGRYEAGEPLITRGVSANLLDANGIIIRTATLEESSLAAQGIICFQLLPSGQYSVNVISGAYNPTGSNLFTVSVTDVGAPELFDYGATLIVSDSATLSQSTLETPIDRDTVLRAILFSTLGAIIVLVAMSLVGFVLYWLIFAGRLRELRAAQAYARATGTGSMRAVYKGDTGNVATIRPSTGPIPAVPITQTDAPHPTGPYDVPSVNPDDDTGQHPSV